MPKFNSAWIASLNFSKYKKLCLYIFTLLLTFEIYSFIKKISPFYVSYSDKLTIVQNILESQKKSDEKILIVGNSTEMNILRNSLPYYLVREYKLHYVRNHVLIESIIGKNNYIPDDQYIIWLNLKENDSYFQSIIQKIKTNIKNKNADILWESEKEIVFKVGSKNIAESQKMRAMSDKILSHIENLDLYSKISSFKNGNSEIKIFGNSSFLFSSKIKESKLKTYVNFKYKRDAKELKAIFASDNNHEIAPSFIWIDYTEESNYFGDKKDEIDKFTKQGKFQILNKNKNGIFVYAHNTNELALKKILEKIYLYKHANKIPGFIEVFGNTDLFHSTGSKYFSSGFPLDISYHSKSKLAENVLSNEIHSLKNRSLVWLDLSLESKNSNQNFESILEVQDLNQPKVLYRSDKQLLVELGNPNSEKEQIILQVKKYAQGPLFKSLGGVPKILGNSTSFYETGLQDLSKNKYKQDFHYKRDSNAVVKLLKNPKHRLLRTSFVWINFSENGERFLPKKKEILIELEKAGHQVLFENSTKALILSPSSISGRVMSLISNSLNRIKT